MKLNVSLIAAMVASMLLVGCSSKNTNDAKEPKDVLGNYREAIAKKDKAYFMSCLSVSDAQKDQVAAQYDLMTQMFDFQEALKKTYGENSLRAGALKSELPTDSKWVDQLKIDAKDSTATVTDKSGVSKQTLQLVKEGGIWKIKPELPYSKDQLDKMKDAVKKATKDKVGKAGYTAAIVERELGAELAGIVSPTAASKPASKPAPATLEAPKK